jgi:DNA invertase Pin-like site-specific DNA recombinase
MKTLETMGSSALSSPKREIIRIKANAAMEPAKLRVAGYARVSSDSADQHNSFSAQVRHYTKLIEGNESWQFVEVYADEGITGVSTEKRDDFNRMISDCRKGIIDRIITKSTSRFARNTLDTIRTIRELKEIGVTVFFEKEGIDTAKITSENLITLYALFAQEESLSISKNCKKGVRMRMHSGTYVSTNPAYGYRLVDNQLEVYEPEAQIVQRIFSEYLGGRGILEIAKGLTADGVPRKDGKAKWHNPAISVILKNERYVGDMLMQKQYNEDALPYRERKNNGELPQYYVKNTHEPIIDTIQFELVNILLRERAEARGDIQYGQYPLGLKIRCGECGATYRRRVNNGETYWVCRAHNENKNFCDSKRIAEEVIYSAFIRLYNKLKQNYAEILLPILSQLEKLREMKARGNLEINTINKQIAELSEQNHVMNGLLSKGILDSALFISQSDELNHKVRSLKQAKARLLEDDETGDLIDKTEELIEIIESSPDYIDEMDVVMFDDMVEGIIAGDSNSDTIDFILPGGLRLTERL